MTVAQTVIRFGIPPAESIPTICQFAPAFRSGSRILPLLWLFPTFIASVAGDVQVPFSLAK